MNLYKTAATVTLCSAVEHFLGFLYRIVLSRTLGEEGLGVYQIALSVFSVFLTVSASGLPITLSRVISKHRALKNGRERSATTAAMLISLSFSVPLTLLLFLLRTPFSQVFSDPRCADLFYILLFGLSFTSLYSVIRGSFWGNKRFFAYSFVELIEEAMMIAIGVFLLFGFSSGVADVNKAAIAMLVSHLLSFALAAAWYFFKGGRISSPRGEFLPLLKSSLPVTAMRTSSSLVSSLVSVLFPLRMMAAGASSSRALAEYGVFYGMVSPVVFIPNTLISSIALVLVPELAECYYKKETEKLSRLVERTLSAALLIAGAVFPFFLVCGKSLGVLLFGSAESGRMISACSLLLVPMSLTMVATSILNSMNCERQTLLFFLAGSCAMLAAVWFLPPYLGSGALFVGMAADYLVTAVCSLALLNKKAGRPHIGGFVLRLLGAVLPISAGGVALGSLFMRFFSLLPAFLLTVLFLAAGELLLFRAFKLFDAFGFLKKFFRKKATRRVGGVRAPKIFPRIAPRPLPFRGKRGIIASDIGKRRNKQ